MRACLVCSRNIKEANVAGIEWARVRVVERRRGGHRMSILWVGVKTLVFSKRHEDLLSILWAVVKTLVFSKRHEDLLNFEQTSDMIWPMFKKTILAPMLRLDWWRGVCQWEARVRHGDQLGAYCNKSRLEVIAIWTMVIMVQTVRSSKFLVHFESGVHGGHLGGSVG